MTEEQNAGPRARNRAAIEASLRAVGRRHLAEHGAAALSLRAVARDMDIAPSALYRYVRDRDELLTLLIVDAYNDLADALDAAVAQRRAPRTRFIAFATALRDWALANTSEYALLYGSPVPGYRAPAEMTNRAGERPLWLLASIVDDQAVPEVVGTSASVQRSAADALAGLTDADGPVIARTINVWNLLLGSISSELFEQLGHVTDKPAAVFAGVADLAASLLFG